MQPENLNETHPAACKSTFQMFFNICNIAIFWSSLWSQLGGPRSQKTCNTIQQFYPMPLKRTAATIMMSTWTPGWRSQESTAATNICENLEVPGVKGSKDAKDDVKTSTISKSRQQVHRHCLSLSSCIYHWQWPDSAQKDGHHCHRPSLTISSIVAVDHSFFKLFLAELLDSWVTPSSDLEINLGCVIPCWLSAPLHCCLQESHVFGGKIPRPPTLAELLDSWVTPSSNFEICCHSMLTFELRKKFGTPHSRD